MEVHAVGLLHRVAWSMHAQEALATQPALCTGGGAGHQTVTSPIQASYWCVCAGPFVQGHRQGQQLGAIPAAAATVQGKKIQPTRLARQ